MSGGWIGVDLDGTLAKYEGWKGGGHIGEPVPAMVERVRRWLAKGQEVRIFTARVAIRNGEELEEAMLAIQSWCVKHIGVMLPITCTKDFGMIHLYDDRCTAVEPNTGRLIGVDEDSHA